MLSVYVITCNSEAANFAWLFCQWIIFTRRCLLKYTALYYRSKLDLAEYSKVWNEIPGNKLHLQWSINLKQLNRPIVHRSLSQVTNVHCTSQFSNTYMKMKRWLVKVHLWTISIFINMMKSFTSITRVDSVFLLNLNSRNSETLQKMQAHYVLSPIRCMSPLILSSITYMVSVYCTPGGHISAVRREKQLGPPLMLPIHRNLCILWISLHNPKTSGNG